MYLRWDFVGSKPIWGADFSQFPVDSVVTPFPICSCFFFFFFFYGNFHIALFFNALLCCTWLLHRPFFVLWFCRACSTRRNYVIDFFFLVKYAHFRRPHYGRSVFISLTLHGLWRKKSPVVASSAQSTITAEIVLPKSLLSNQQTFIKWQPFLVYNILRFILSQWEVPRKFRTPRVLLHITSGRRSHQADVSSVNLSPLGSFSSNDGKGNEINIR